MPGCNKSEPDNKSSTAPQSSETLTNEQSTAVTSGSEPISESSSANSDNSQAMEQPIDREENTLSIMITVNGLTFSATLYDNETSRVFKELLPLTLDMSELNGNEKYYYLPDSLPKDSSIPSRINTGDIMLYGSDCLVFFYESFSTSYSYTPIGKIDNPDGLAAAFGSGSVQVTFN